MTTSLASSERAALCDTAIQVGPTAPTLCAGWTAADLMAHLLTREDAPLALLAERVMPHLERRRTAGLLGRFGYAGLVDRFREGPPIWTPYRLPGVDVAANTMEFFVHHEDLRRGADPHTPARELTPAQEDELWRRAAGLGRLMLRHSPVGVVLERRTAADPPSGATSDAEHGDILDTMTLKPGDQMVHVVGQPGELVLWLFGRTSAAHVDLIGQPDAVEALSRVKLGL